jgi:hypothetical protein
MARRNRRAASTVRWAASSWRFASGRLPSPVSTAPTRPFSMSTLAPSTGEAPVPSIRRAE